MTLGFGCTWVILNEIPLSSFTHNLKTAFANLSDSLSHCTWGNKSTFEIVQDNQNVLRMKIIPQIKYKLGRCSYNVSKSLTKLKPRDKRITFISAMLNAIIFISDLLTAGLCLQ